MPTFSINPPLNFIEEGKWLLAVSSFETTNFLFNITNENNIFSLSTVDYWSSRGGAETIYKLQNLLELRSQEDIELIIQEVRKRENLIEIRDSENKLSDFDTHKNEIYEELKNEE